MRARFTLLRDLLLDAADGGTVHYVPNPGNLGDGLIRVATLRFLADAGIDFIDHPEGFSPSWAAACSQDTLIYGGGGAWCRLWSHSLDVIRAAEPLFRRVVVLPSTFEIGLDGTRAVLFARDRLDSLAAAPRARFCDDMAFYLAPPTAPPGEGTLNCFRRDREGVFRYLPRRGNRDLAARGTHLDDPAQLFDALAGSARVRTDRLHVAIAAALLGKRVQLHAGSYFKNRAVFQSSLEPHFDRVRFYDSRRSR